MANMINFRISQIPLVMGKIVLTHGRWRTIDRPVIPGPGEPKQPITGLQLMCQPIAASRDFYGPNLGANGKSG